MYLIKRTFIITCQYFFISMKILKVSATFLVYYLLFKGKKYYLSRSYALINYYYTYLFKSFLFVEDDQSCSTGNIYFIG